MAVDALGSSGVNLGVLELRFVQVAVLALGARVGHFIVLAQLYDAFVGIMADHAVNGDVLALEELLILFVVFDESTAGVD
jgi:hypothetical protein